MFDDRESVVQFVLVALLTLAALVWQYRGHLVGDYVVTAFEHGDYFYQKHCQYVTLRPTRDVAFGGHQHSRTAAIDVKCPPWPPTGAGEPR